MIVADQESLRQRAELIVSHLAAAWTNAEIVDTTAAVGGGSLPGDTLPSVGIALLNRASITIDALARSLRVGSPAVFGHIEQRRLVFDLRTVLPEEDALLIKALQAVSVH
jgi:L-seryl-tRNA(Ser) seleniumtransferase